MFWINGESSIIPLHRLQRSVRDNQRGNRVARNCFIWRQLSALSRELHRECWFAISRENGMSRSVRNCIKTKAMVLKSKRASLKEARRRAALRESLLSSRDGIRLRTTLVEEMCYLVRQEPRGNSVARCIENVERRIKMNFGLELFINWNI